MPVHPLDRRSRVAIGLLLAAALPAFADDDRTAGPPPLPAYTQECGACHVAYPPGLLPAASWQRLMATLPRHFGTDASLDAAATREIAAWLEGHAARTGKRAREAPPEDRITRTAWFLREHDRITPASWRRPAVKSAANCTACHPRADRGDFDEHAVRIPK